MEEIYEAYKDEMYYIAYGILRNKHDAEDVVHETFVALLANPEGIAQDSPQKTWNYIMTIVKNKSCTLYRTKQRQADYEIEEEVLEDVFDEEADFRLLEREQKKFLAKALRRMKRSYREILLLQYYHDKSIAEIARLLGKSSDNVRHMSERARKKLKKLLKKYGFESM